MCTCWSCLPELDTIFAGLGGQRVRWDSECIQKDRWASTCVCDDVWRHTSFPMGSLRCVMDALPAFWCFLHVRKATASYKCTGCPHCLEIAARKTTPRPSQWKNSTKHWGPTTSHVKPSICHLSILKDCRLQHIAASIAFPVGCHTQFLGRSLQTEVSDAGQGVSPLLQAPTKAHQTYMKQRQYGVARMVWVLCFCLLLHLYLY